MPRVEPGMSPLLQIDSWLRLMAGTLWGVILIAGCSGGDSSVGTVPLTNSSGSSGGRTPVAYLLAGGGSIQVAADEVVIKFKANITAAERQVVQSFLAAQGAEIIDVFDDVPEWSLTIVKVNPAGLLSMINSLSNLAGVEFAQPSPVVSTQWDPSPAGWGCGVNWPNCDSWISQIGARQAWEKTRGIAENGFSPVSLLVVDSPVGNNPFEGTARFIKTVSQGEKIKSLYDQQILLPLASEHEVGEFLAATPIDPNKLHGTQVATILAAPGDDGKGSAGLVWGSEVWGVNFNIERARTYSQLAKVIVRAIRAIGQRGLIVNISLGPEVETSANYGQFMEQLVPAFIAAAQNDALLVFASGNGSITNFDTIPLPAPSEVSNYILMDHLIFVGGISADKKPVYNRGRAVQIAAPAENIGTSLMVHQGTSYAAPQVAGAAALVKSLNPAFTAAEIKYRLTNSACPVAGVRMLNVWRAVDPTVSEEMACTYSPLPPRANCVQDADPITGRPKFFFNCVVAGVIGSGNGLSESRGSRDWYSSAPVQFDLAVPLAQGSAQVVPIQTTTNQTGRVLPTTPISLSAQSSNGGLVPYLIDPKTGDVITYKRTAGSAGTEGAITNQFLLILDPARGSLAPGKAVLRATITVDWSDGSYEYINGTIAGSNQGQAVGIIKVPANGGCPVSIHAGYEYDPAGPPILSPRLVVGLPSSTCNEPRLVVITERPSRYSHDFEIPFDFRYGEPVEVSLSSEASSYGLAHASVSITISGIDVDGGLTPDGDILAGDAATVGLRL